MLTDLTKIYDKNILIILEGLKMIKKLFIRILSYEQSRFIMVGIMNTLIGTLAMLLAYNIFHLGYWLSSIMDYIIGSIFSFFANKYFTFKVEKKSKKEIIRFIINIIVCYLLAYGFARPVMEIICRNIELSKSLFEQISMLFGTVVFIVINYFGQKFFVFKKDK